MCTTWDTSDGGRDHGTQGYLTSFSEADPVYTASAAGGVVNTRFTNWDSAYGWGNHGTQGYLTSFSEADPVYTASEKEVR